MQIYLFTLLPALTQKVVYYNEYFTSYIFHLTMYLKKFPRWCIKSFLILFLLTVHKIPLCGHYYWLLPYLLTFRLFPDFQFCKQYCSVSPCTCGISHWNKYMWIYKIANIDFLTRKHFMWFNLKSVEYIFRYVVTGDKVFCVLLIYHQICMITWCLKRVENLHLNVLFSIGKVSICTHGDISQSPLLVTSFSNMSSYSPLPGLSGFFASRRKPLDESL